MNSRLIKSSCLLNAIHHPILIKNLNHEILEVNDAFLYFFKKSINELIGKKDFDVLEFASEELYIKTDREVITLKDRLTYETTIIINQIEKVITINKTYCRELENEFIIVLFNDITEKKITEDSLNSTLKRLTDFQNAIDKYSSISISNSKGKIIYVNDKFCNNTKYSEDEILGKKYDIFHSDFHTKEFLFNLIQSLKRGEIWNGEVKNKAKDGTTYWTNTTIVPLLNEEGVATEYLSMEHNITQIKEHNTQLQIEKEKANIANIAKSQFLANVSHEIRSPLNAIVGFSQILLQKSETVQLTDDFKNYLNNIKIAGQNLAELINNILDLSKIEAGKMTTSMEVLNFKQLFLSIIHINKPIAINKKIQFNYSYDPNLPEFLISDRTKLNQILMNLISNSIKFTPTEKKIEILAQKEDSYLKISVVDTGIGIPLEKQKIIFDPFVQADSSITRNYGGTGLGLSITKQIVTLLDGTISVQSETGKGSAFIVKLPFTEVKNENTNSLNLPIENFQFSQSNKILLVEDNMINIEMMKGFFDLLKLEIIVAENGKIGVEKVNKLKPDLILMDLHMPVMDGFEATRLIKSNQETKNIPVIGLTADTLLENEIIQVNFDEILTKPIDFQKLLITLSKHLEKNQIPLEKLNKANLPENIHEEVEIELKELNDIPFLKSMDIIEKIDLIRSKCKPYKTKYIEGLNLLEDYLYKSNEELYNKKILELIKGSTFFE